LQIIRSVEEMVNKISIINKQGKSIGFVPTMGFLHIGHKSLIDAARKENEVVVVSVFVNPAQFGPNEDFEAYPRSEEKDAFLCREAGCNIMFIPEPDEMYSEGYNTYIEVHGLTEGLCGASRPGHFKGVCTIVLKLFNIVRPKSAYFGQKDAQQLAVIKKMARDLNLNVKVIGCPIIREADGLALSSRNTYLNVVERSEALVLSKSLNRARVLIENGEYKVETLKEEMKKIIASASTADVDYIEIVDSETLKAVEVIEEEVLIAIAVKIGRTRLIDNMVVNI
jgi:pantoate--beta-alanine ligase